MIDRARGIFPGAWRNPLRHHMGPNVLPGFRLAIIQEASVKITDFTTTNVGTAQQVLTQNVYMSTAEICLYVFASFVVEHTVAGATFDARLHLGIDDGPSAEYLIAELPGIYLATANRNFPVHISIGLNIKANLPLVTRPGNRRVGLYVINNTAGTLTVPSSNNVNPVLHLFVAGDAT